MDFDTFDTDFWSEIQDAPGEIFDIEEGMEDEQTWNQFVNSNVTVWQVAHGGGCKTPQTMLFYIRTWDTQCPTLSLETSTVICLVMISGIWSMLCQVMLWIMMISLQKMFTPFVTKSMLSSTTMIDTYSFAGDGVTVLGLVGVISTGIILVLCFTRYFNSPMRK